MKTSVLVIATIALFSGVTRAADKSIAVPSRVGVYDSRAVSFAHFWSAPVRQQRDTLIATAEAAKAQGDQERFEKLRKEIAAASKHSHLQVFSTAPADEAMAALKDKLPAIQAELGVARIVSKWDSDSLRGVASENQIDVTDRLVREFNPDEKRRHTIAAMQTKPPLSLWKAKLLLLFGGM